MAFVEVRMPPGMDGVEALSLKNDRNIGHIDLLFTDVVMPQMSGNELADRMRALHPQTKILSTSAHTENTNVHQGVLDKSVALLQKPCIICAGTWAQAKATSRT